MSEFQTAIAAGEDEVQRRFMVLCLIGLTGSGKSMTANSLCGEQKFSVSGGTESETTAFDGALTRWFNEPNEDPVIVIDTPGIGDSKGRDTKHIAEMVVGLKNVGYAHAFLIVVNSADPRLSDQLQETLTLFSQMFSPEFFRNALLVFTRFAHDDTSKWRRDNNQSMSEA